MSDHPPPASPSPAAKPRFLRRWCRRLAWSLALGLLVLVCFYRPLIRWAAAYFGQRAAAQAGLQASWNLEGNLYGGVHISQVKVTGNDQAQLRVVTLDHVTLEYDLGKLRTEGVGAVLQEITLEGLDAEIDLTKPGEPAAPATKAKPAPAAQLPQLRFPKVNLAHVNLHLKHPSGLVVVEDFSLTLDPAGPGIIAWERLVVPGLPALGPMKGITHLTPTSLQLENLALRPDTFLEMLSVDIAKLAQEQASCQIALSQGAGKLALSATVRDWNKELAVDVTTKVSNLRAADLKEWGVPQDVAWGVESLNFSAQGPVLKPALLQWQMQAASAPLELPGLRVDGIRVEAKAAEGKLQVQSLRAVSGANEFLATAEAALPNDWSQAAASAGKVNFKLDAQNLAELSSQVEGSAHAEGSLEFAAQKLSGAQATLIAKQLRTAGIPVESVEVNVSTAQELVTLEKLHVTLNEQNTIAASGTLELTGQRHFTMAWQADCANLASLPAQVRADSLWPTAGVVHSAGKATGSLPAVQQQDWATLQGTIKLVTNGVKLHDATLQSLQLQGSLEQGVADLTQLALQLDAENSLHAQGQVTLGKPEFPLHADLSLALPKVAALTAWSEQFGGPPLESGSVQLSWKAAGSLHPMLLDGQGTADISNLKLASNPLAFGLHATITQQGETAHIPTMEATAGPWRAAGSMAWDGRRLNITSLEGWLKELSLVKLAASLPLKYQTEPLQLAFSTAQLDSAKVAAALGQKFPAQGIVNVTGDFNGTLQTMQGSLLADVSKIKMTQKEAAPLAPGNFTAALKLADGQLTLEAQADQKPLAPLTVHAAVPVDLPALLEQPALAQQLPLVATLRLPKSSLDFLPTFVPALQRLVGTLAVTADLSGTVAAPKINGTVQVALPDAAFTDPSLPTIKNLNLVLRADEEHVHVQEAKLLLSGGPLQLSGTMGIANLADPTLDFKLHAEEILLTRDEMLSLRANADLSCLGKLSAATVAGRVDLVRGRVFKEVEIVPMSLPNQLPPPPRSTTVGRDGPPQLPALLAPWKFDVAVKTKDPIRLMSTVAHGSAVVDLLLGGTGANPQLTGKVHLEDAWVKLPFSRLNLTHTEVTFNNEHPFDPQMELLGEAIVSNYQVTVNVAGRALDPKLRFSSSPPLSEGDITCLLATGTTASDLGSGNGEAAGRALFLVIQSAYRKLFPKLAAAAEEQQPPNLTFELSGFGNDPSRRGVAAIYEITPKVRAIGRVGENGSFRGMLYYQIRFK